MKRILFIFSFVFVVFEGNSQIITGTYFQLTDCNNSEGYIKIITAGPPGFRIWEIEDSLSNWVLDTSGQGLDSIGFSECGNYRVTAYNSSYTSFEVEYFSVPCPTMETEVSAHENIECNGDSTGILKHVVSGGVPFNPDGIPDNGDEYYHYSWYKDGILFSSGPNDTILTNLCNGQSKSIPYLLYIEDSAGCIYQPLNDTTGLPDTSFMYQPDLIRIDSLLINSVHCKGTNTGSVVVNVKDGKRFKSVNYYDFYLTNTFADTIRKIDRNGMSANIVSDTTPYYVLFDSLGIGNYTIHVVDSFGCTLDTVIYVMDPDNYNLHVSIDYNSSFVCEQDPTSIKIDSVSGGHSNLEYYWEGPLLHSDSIYVPAGIYKAYIMDITYGCKDSLYYTFTAPNIIEADVTSTKAKCFGENSGSLQVDSIHGGTPPYTIQWGGINTDSLYAGIYTLFITDSLGCLYMEDHEVFENPNVELNDTIYHLSCFGSSDGSIAINLTGGTSPLNYFWLNGTGSPNLLSYLPADTYVLQTTDSLGCTFSDSVVVSEPDALVVNFEGYTNPLSCNGGQTLINAIITGGTSPYNYNWSTSSTMSQIIAAAGNYNISVTDTNGCTSTNQILITEPELLEIINTSFVQASCNIGATASIIVSGGTGDYLYIWSNGDTTSYASDLEEGIQWVFVTDSCGSTDSISFEVESYILETNIYYDNSDNYADVDVIFNTEPPYSYQWYEENINMDNLISGSTDSILDNLCPQTWYFCIITDANNCKDTVSVLADFHFPMGGIIDESTTTVYEDSQLWGSEPYTYLWDNGDITVKGNICPGFHRVWVTDVNGCEVVGELNIEDILLTLSPSEIIIECDITNLDVELEVTATGGTGNYTYLWSNGQTENPINLSLNPGVYGVEITDENLCNEDTIFHIAAMSSDCIPNVFSPNDDGSNDVWNLEDAFFYLDSEVRIYNRYGKLVFKSVGYENPWDGKNESGNDVEDGAYFYVIDLANDIEKIKGTVSIIR